MSLVLLLFGWGFFLLRAKSEALELTPETFETTVGNENTNTFVMFYAPWCGHCKKFKPDYDNVALSFRGVDNVVIAKVDADAHKDIAEKHGVSGFPTLKYFPAGAEKGTKYTGARTTADVVEYINKELGTSVKPYEAPSFVKVLTESNFDSALRKEKAALVEFYAPWCGHCKKLQPTYEKVASAFQNEENVVIGKVDATEEKKLAQKYGVKGYPTIKFFPEGSDEPIDYNSGRNLRSFVNFINENAGTRRNEDGTLKKSAGRVAELDSMANQFFTQESQRDALLEQMRVAEFSDDEKKYYIKFAEKIAAKGSEFVEKEISRLSNLIVSGSVKPQIKKSMTLRRNVLRGFLEGPESMKEDKTPKTEL